MTTKGSEPDTAVMIAGLCSIMLGFHFVGLSIESSFPNPFIFLLTFIGIIATFTIYVHLLKRQQP